MMHTHKHSYMISQTYTSIFSITCPRLGVVAPSPSFLAVLILIIFAHSHTINTVVFLFLVFFGCGGPLWQNGTSRNSGCFCNLSKLDCDINCNLAALCSTHCSARLLVGAASGCFFIILTYASSHSLSSRDLKIVPPLPSWRVFPLKLWWAQNITRNPTWTHTVSLQAEPKPWQQLWA